MKKVKEVKNLKKQTVQVTEQNVAVKSRVSQSRNAFFEEEEKRHVKERSRRRINWKLILIIFVAGLLMLAIFYFVLSYVLLK